MALVTVKLGDVVQSTSNELAVELPVLVIFAETIVVVVDSVVGVTDKLIVFVPRRWPAARTPSATRRAAQMKRRQ